MTRAALRQVGVFGTTLSRRLADGRLWELFAPVLVVGIRPEHVTPDLVAAAAVMAAGPIAALDGASALERRGLWKRHDGTLYVTSTRGRAHGCFDVPSAWRAGSRWRARPDRIAIRYSRQSAGALAAVDLLDGIPTRSAVDALCRAARHLTPYQLAFIIHRAEYAREFTLDELERVIALRRGERGVRALRAAIALRRAGSVGTRSRSEDVALPALARACGTPAVNVRGSAGIPTHEPDFCWPSRRLIVEIDGDHHLEDPQRRESDLRTDELLRATGWTVIRIHWTRVWRDLPGVVAEVRAASTRLRRVR